MLSYAELRLLKTTLAVAARDTQSSTQAERIEEARAILAREERHLLLRDYGYLDRETKTEEVRDG